MGSVVARHPQSHTCSPGWENYEADLPGLGPTTCRRPIDPGDGAVWECECGRTWVCYHDTRGGFMGALWRPEKRRERRKRTALTDGSQ